MINKNTPTIHLNVENITLSATFICETSKLHLKLLQLAYVLQSCHSVVAG